MEVGQGPNWGSSAKEKKSCIRLGALCQLVTIDYDHMSEIIMPVSKNIFFAVIEYEMDSIRN
jgi:hypothetical protein